MYVRLNQGEGNGNPLQCSSLENPTDGGAYWAAVHGVAESRTRLSNFTFTFYFHALEKEMATHSSVLAWRIPGMLEPDGLPSMGSHRVGYDWSDLAAAAALAPGAWKEEHSRDDVEWPPKDSLSKIAGETDPEDIRDLEKGRAGKENCRPQLNKSQQHLFKSISQNNGN